MNGKKRQSKLILTQLVLAKSRSHIPYVCALCTAYVLSQDVETISGQMRVCSDGKFLWFPQLKKTSFSCNVLNLNVARLLMTEKVDDFNEGDY